MAKRFGFTLAEVLITLGIIGVVAAMTIPTLISNTNGAQFKSAYKKALSTLNQAILMNIALEDTDFSTVKAETGDVTSPTAGTVADILGKRLVSATVAEIPTIYTTDENAPLAGNVDLGGNETAANGIDTIVKLADGTAFLYNSEDSDCTADSKCLGFIDANGETLPNTVTTCSGDTEEGGTDTTTCKVEAADVHDLFPVWYYGQTIEPASDAARAVLFGK